MKRYDPFFTDDLGSYCQAQMELDIDGDWVAYEDVQELEQDARRYRELLYMVQMIPILVLALMR